LPDRPVQADDADDAKPEARAVREQRRLDGADRPPLALVKATPQRGHRATPEMAPRKAAVATTATRLTAFWARERAHSATVLTMISSGPPSGPDASTFFVTSPQISDRR
jgi:hypothetical protein